MNSFATTPSRRSATRRIVAAGAAALIPLVALSPSAAATTDVFEQVSPTPITYVERDDFIEMQHSMAGEVTAPVWAVPIVPTASPGWTASGCSASDFAGFAVGSIALIQRGSCTFNVKASNALAAGAVGVIIPNEGNTPDRLATIYGTLGASVAIPVVGTSFAVGQDLRNGVAVGATGSVVHMRTDGLAPALSPAEQLVALGNVLAASGAPSNVTGPLQAKLDAAQAAMDRDNTGAACNQLRAFENQVRAQSGKKLTTAQADDLLTRAAALRTTLGC